MQPISQAADLVLTITLRDGSVDWIGNPAAELLAEAAVGVLDGILRSLTLTQ